MSRAEYRRAFKKQASSRKTFVMTREELDKIRMQEFERAKKLLTKTNEQMAEDIIRMMLVIPTNVLIADHWEKSAKRRIPKFVEDCISLYQAWEQGAVSMDEMQKLTEEYSGIKLVDSKTPTGRVLKERKRKEDAGRSSKSTKIRKPDVVEEPKPEEQIEGQMSVEDFQEVLPEKKDVEIRKPTEEEKEVLNSLARKLIRDKYDYFLQDYQNRVAHVIKAEEELKKHISIDRRTGIYFISGMNTYYVNLFEDYIQLWGMEFIGKFEWFYLMAAIQSQWNARKAHEEPAYVECEVVETEDAEPEVCDVAQLEEEDSEQDKELYNEPDDRSDLRIAQDELRSAQDYLQILKEEFAPTDIRVRKQTILVAALASCVSDLDEIENPIPEPEQPELPRFRNNDQRKEWLSNYQDWGIWYEDHNIGCRYYKYDFECGAKLIVETYRDAGNQWMSKWEACYFHLVGGKELHKKYGSRKWNYHDQYSKYPSSETELVEFLKAIQKEEK